MKLYALRERWGRSVISSRAPESKAMPKEPIVRAGIGINMVNWQEWATRPLAERVIIYNVLVSFALDTLKLHAPHVIPWVNGVITKSIAYELAWGAWIWAGAIAVYAGVVLIMIYYAPVEKELYVQEVAPHRYLFRYQAKVWAADLIAVSRLGRPYYNICYEIGEIIVGEDRRHWTPLGVLDRWNTGYLWIQRKDRIFKHHGLFWFTCYVDYIGLLEHVGDNLYALKFAYRDPYISEIERPYIVPPEYRCREWNPEYRFP